MLFCEYTRKCLRVSASVCVNMHVNIYANINFEQFCNAVTISLEFCRKLVLITFSQFNCCNINCTKITNKKVLLRERKGHTDRRVASAHSAVLSRGGGGYPSSGWGRGNPCPDLATGGTSPPVDGQTPVKTLPPHIPLGMRAEVT